MQPINQYYILAYWFFLYVCSDTVYNIMIFQKQFINKSHESIGLSPYITSFRCSVSPLVGILNKQRHDTEQRITKPRTYSCRN